MDKAQSRVLEGYYEEHHIKPKSVHGEGPVVRLTAREHFIAHRLLIKFTTGAERRKMLYAFNCMAFTRKFKLTSSQYESARKAFSEALSLDVERGRKISMSKKGRIFSPEHREALSRSQIGTKQSEETKAKRSESLKLAHAEGRHSGVRGKKHIDMMTEEARLARAAKISAALTGKKLSAEHVQKIKDSGFGTNRKGSSHSQETKAKMAEARRLYWEKKRSSLS